MYENNDKISHNKSPSTSRDWEMAKQKKQNHWAKGSAHYAIIV